MFSNIYICISCGEPNFSGPTFQMQNYYVALLTEFYSESSQKWSKEYITILMLSPFTSAKNACMQQPHNA